VTVPRKSGEKKKKERRATRCIRYFSRVLHRRGGREEKMWPSAAFLDEEKEGEGAAVRRLSLFRRSGKKGREVHRRTGSTREKKGEVGVPTSPSSRSPWFCTRGGGRLEAGQAAVERGEEDSADLSDAFLTVAEREKKK